MTPLSQDQKHALVRLLAGRLARAGRDVAMESLQRKGLVVRTQQFDELTTDGFVRAAEFPYVVGVRFQGKARRVWGVYKTHAAAKAAMTKLTADRKLPLPEWWMLGSALQVSQALRES